MGVTIGGLRLSARHQLSKPMPRVVVLATTMVRCTIATRAHSLTMIVASAALVETIGGLQISASHQLSMPRVVVLATTMVRCTIATRAHSITIIVASAALVETIGELRISASHQQILYFLSENSHA